MKKNYEYVNWEEARPVKVGLNSINQKMQSYMRNNHPELLFDVDLVGSAKRKLITREVNGNQGFDFDYNLVISKPPQGKIWDAEVVKQFFMDAADFAVSGTGYSHPKDSTRAITIKKVDRKNSRIRHSCDYAIIYYEDAHTYYYLRNNKTNGSYSFEKRVLKYPIDVMEQYINENAGQFSTTGTEWIREEYLKVKNGDTQEKESHILYVEALYNIINYIQQYSDDDDNEDYDDDDNW